MSKFVLTPHKDYARGKGKLTDDEVRFIRASELPLAELGRMFNMHYTTMTNIKAGLTYKHVNNTSTPVKEYKTHG